MNDTTSPEPGATGPQPTDPATASSDGARPGTTPPPNPAQQTGPGYQAGPSPQPAYAPPAPMLESEARTIAMLIHILAAVAAILSAGTLAFLVPLVMWLIYRERSALVDHHGKLNLNLQLTLLVVVVGGFVLGLVTAFIGFIVTIPAMIAYAIYTVVMSFIAGTRANRGEYSTIPLVIPFIR